jgi:hypothetical protein
MSVLLITYDLHTPGQDYSDFHKAIKRHSWARLSESSYAIATDSSPAVVASAFRNYMDENDVLYVVTLRAPYSGWGPNEVNQWLAQNLT